MIASYCKSNRVTSVVMTDTYKNTACYFHFPLFSLNCKLADVCR